MKKKKIPTNKSPRQDVLIVQQEMNGKMMWYVCIYVCVCVCVCVCIHMLCLVTQSFTIPWTIAHQAPLSMGILQTRILKRVVMPSSRGSSHLKIELSSPHCRQIPSHLSHRGSPLKSVCSTNLLYSTICLHSQEILIE